MLAPLVLAILVAPAPLTTQATATSQPPAPQAQTTPEKPWPPEGVFRVSDDGVSSPRLIKSPKANYRPAAMRARVQGGVRMEAVVQTDGSVGEIRVVRSLDKEFGMDDEAVETLKQWRFEPGKKDGEVVPILVVVEMTFTIRK